MEHVDVASGQQNEASANNLFLPFRCFCTRKDVSHLRLLNTIKLLLYISKRKGKSITSCILITTNNNAHKQSVPLL